MDYPNTDSAGVIGIYGTVTAPRGGDSRCQITRTRERQAPQSKQPTNQPKRVLLIEKDQVRAEEFRANLELNSDQTKLHVVSSDLDALDLLTVHAEFKPESLPDVLVLGTGVAVKHGTFCIMRFIKNDERFASMQVVATADLHATIQTNTRGANTRASISSSAELVRVYA